MATTRSRAIGGVPTDRQLRNLATFEALAERDRILELVIAYVERFLNVVDMGETWGITFCPSGTRPGLAVINAGSGVCPLALGDNTVDGCLRGFIAMQDTSPAYGLADQARRAGHHIPEARGDTPVPWIGFSVPAWEPLTDFIDSAADLIAAFVNQGTSRRLLNAGWHNPAAGDLLLDAMGRPDEWERNRTINRVRRTATGRPVSPKLVGRPVDTTTRLCPGCGLRRTTAQFIADSPLCIDCR